MIGRVPIVENCRECPFFDEAHGMTMQIPYCWKLRLSGEKEKLFEHCPLPKVKDIIIWEHVIDSK